MVRHRCCSDLITATVMREASLSPFYLIVANFGGQRTLSTFNYRSWSDDLVCNGIFRRKDWERQNVQYAINLDLYSVAWVGPSPSLT
ncbi:hypothetical protein AAHA92_06256 [Salvia divinorum]|uniref:Uncharacterized protein n=1 Tax=Salvia divinorum TaxID=28513 RepID=A0ABD1I541_SALDI